MKTIKEGVVFSNDIKRILDGVNAFNYKYQFIPNKSIIETVRNSFKKETNKIFNEVTIISEEEMLEVNKLIGGEYPHCYSR